MRCACPLLEESPVHAPYATSPRSGQRSVWNLLIHLRRWWALVQRSACARLDNLAHFWSLFEPIVCVLNVPIRARRSPTLRFAIDPVRSHRFRTHTARPSSHSIACTALQSVRRGLRQRGDQRALDRRLQHLLRFCRRHDSRDTAALLSVDLLCPRLLALSHCQFAFSTEHSAPPRLCRTTPSAE